MQQDMRSFFRTHPVGRNTQLSCYCSCNLPQSIALHLNIKGSGISVSNIPHVTLGGGGAPCTCLLGARTSPFTGRPSSLIWATTTPAPSGMSVTRVLELSSCTNNHELGKVLTIIIWGTEYDWQQWQRTLQSGETITFFTNSGSVPAVSKSISKRGQLLNKGRSSRFSSILQMLL